MLVMTPTTLWTTNCRSDSRGDLPISVLEEKYCIMYDAIITRIEKMNEWDIMSNRVIDTPK
jgi:hypothetical protein